MAKEQLYRTQFGAAFQQVRRKRIPQCMGRHGLGKSGSHPSFVTGQADRASADRLVEMRTRKQPLGRGAFRFPVVAQDVQQSG